MPWKFVLSVNKGSSATSGKVPGANREKFPNDRIIGESEVPKIFPISDEVLPLLRDNHNGPNYLIGDSDGNSDRIQYQIGELRNWFSEQIEGVQDSVTE